MCNSSCSIIQILCIKLVGCSSHAVWGCIYETQPVTKFEIFTGNFGKFTNDEDSTYLHKVTLNTKVSVGSMLLG